MERCNSFVRTRVICAAIMILGLLVCCPDVRSQGVQGYHPPAPETLDIGQGLHVPLCISGALVFEADTPKPGVGVEGMVSTAEGSGGPYPGKSGAVGPCGVGIETVAGGWGYPIIQAVTNQSPAKDEVARFGMKDDITAGEPLGDDTITSGMQPTHVKSSSVILQIPIAWSGTGNGMVSEVGTEFWDGDTGVYTARVEDCLSSSDHTKLKQVEDKDGKSIKCTNADGVLGRDGQWYDVSEDPWSSTKYLSLVNEATYGIPGLPKKTIKDTLSIPVDLPVPVNSLRVEFELGIKDSHCSKNCDEPTGSKKMPVYTDPTAKDPYIQSYWGQITGQNSQGQTTVRSAGGPEFLVTRLAIQLPNITVLPAAFLQMKALPYTIVYRPPGDKSQGVYTTNESFGTSLTTGVSTAIDNTTAFEQSMGISTDAKVNLLIVQAEEQDGETVTDTGATDNNSTIGTGLVTSSSHTAVRSWTVGSASADPTILPAAQSVTPNTCTTVNYATSGCTVTPGETFSQEPFWEDQIVVLLNPTAEVWDFKAGTTMQLLGAQEFDSISISDLAACAQSNGKYGWKLINGSQLTPAECQDLLNLDPYYLEGQSLDPSKSNRGVAVGAGNYGSDPRKPTASGVSTAFQDIFTYSTQQSTNASTSYQVAVTNVIGFSWSGGVTLGAKSSVHGLDVGISDGITVTQGNKNTTGTQMKVTYTASTAATSTTTTQISGSFGDDYDFYTPNCQKNPDKCYMPQVKVYIDELFGSYMFSDPDAPKNPLLRIVQPSHVTVPVIVPPVSH